MPNYSHGTKLTLASVEEPPYLTVGTDVSAKYKGAFCEAKIIDVNKHVKLRVLFDGSSGSYLIEDTDLKAGSILATGTRIEAKHPEKTKQQSYVQATITKILDHSRYTVVFDDGDQCILRRNSLCLKSGKHFAESETLDQLPLTNPEHFGNPVKVGASEQLNTQTNVTQNNTPKTQNNTPKTQNSTTKIQNNPPKTQNHLLLNDKPTKVKSSAKRRESVNNGSKNAMDLDDNSVDSSIESSDANSIETNVKYELIEVGVKLMVQYGKGKVQNFYEAKVNKIETNNAGKIRYFVHYTGWNNRYDEWITKSRIHSIVIDKENGSKDRKSKHSEPIAANSNATQISSSTAISTPKTEPRVKDKEVQPRTRRARQSEASINTPVTSNNTQITPSATNLMTDKCTIPTATTTNPITTLSSVPTTLATTSSIATATVNDAQLTTTPVTAPSLTTATTTVLTTVDPVKEVPKLEVALHNAQAVPSPVAATVIPKKEPKVKEKEFQARTRRARQSEAIVITPVTSNSTIIAPLISQPVSLNSSISIATTASVTNSPATLSVTSTPVTFPVTTKAAPPPVTSKPTTLSVTTTLANTLLVVTTSTTSTPVTSIPVVATQQSTISAPTAQTTVEPVKDIQIPAVASPSTPATSVEEVKRSNSDEPVAEIDSRHTYRFCDGIDESDCDKKISILQERILALRQTYSALKTELADLDRRKKRPRTERSNSEHISNCGVVCRS